MRIVEIEALDNGAHQNQNGNFKTVPEGWAIIPDYMEIPKTFQFINITVEDGIVTTIEANHEAYDVAKATEEAAKVEAAEVESNAQDDIDSMLVDHEYRLTMLELFSETSV